MVFFHRPETLTQAWCNDWPWCFRVVGSSPSNAGNRRSYSRGNASVKQDQRSQETVLPSFLNYMRAWRLSHIWWCTEKNHLELLCQNSAVSVAQSLKKNSVVSQTCTEGLGLEGRLAAHLSLESDNPSLQTRTAPLKLRKYYPGELKVRIEVSDSVGSDIKQCLSNQLHSTKYCVVSEWAPVWIEQVIIHRIYDKQVGIMCPRVCSTRAYPSPKSISRSHKNVQKWL